MNTYKKLMPNVCKFDSWVDVMSRASGRVVWFIVCWFVVTQITITPAFGTHLDVNFDINLVSKSDPHSGARDYGDVWAEGNYAYVGSRDYNSGAGVTIFDISDPKNPLHVSTYVSGFQLQDVKVQNGIGYFASNDGSGVDLVDLSDPTNPTLITKIDSQDGGFNKIHNVFIDGNFLYEAPNFDNIGVVKVFDISNPLAPQFVENIDVGTVDQDLHDVTVLNGRLYATSHRYLTTVGSTAIYDISNIGTTGAVFLTTFDSGGETHASWPTDDGNTLVVGQEREGGELRFYDISMIDQPNDPDVPVLLKSLTAASLGINGLTPHNPVIQDDLLFVAWLDAGLQLFDISDPANPQHIGAYDTLPGTSNDFFGNWGVYPFLGLDRVLLSDRDAGLIIVDVTPAVPGTPGDFDADGDVDSGDFLRWQRGQSPNGGNAGDLALWEDKFGTMSGGAVDAVPEPSSLLLLAIICLTASRRRRFFKKHRRLRLAVKRKIIITYE